MPNIDIDKLLKDPSQMESVILQAKTEAWEEFQQEKCKKSTKEEIEATRKIFDYAFDKAVVEIVSIQMKITKALNERKPQ